MKSATEYKKVTDASLHLGELSTSVNQSQAAHQRPMPPMRQAWLTTNMRPGCSRYDGNLARRLRKFAPISRPDRRAECRGRSRMNPLKNPWLWATSAALAIAAYHEINTGFSAKEERGAHSCVGFKGLDRTKCMHRSSLPLRKPPRSIVSRNRLHSLCPTCRFASYQQRLHGLS